MNRDTIWFRIGLSISAVWVMFAAYSIHETYSEIRKESETMSSLSREFRDKRCDKLTVSFDENAATGYVRLRATKPQETAECRKEVRIQNEEISRIAANNRLIDIRDAFLAFLLIGFLPVALLLGIIGYWSKIAAIALAYINWLRFGSTRQK